jgi:uncharacterized protein (DUF305 family)
MRKTSALIAATATLVALAGCSSENDDKPDHQMHSAPNGDEFNDADVEFATAMIPHHAQALQMVDLTRGRKLSPELRRLTEDIQMAQSPEIEQMTRWLTDWEQPVPETARDHVNADDMTSDHDMGGHDTSDGESEMPGMMSEDEMAELEAARGQEFEELWLEMMIDHHQGAIEMAETEESEGEFQPAIDLAEAIATSQQDEIDHMDHLLGS